MASIAGYDLGDGRTAYVEVDDADGLQKVARGQTVKSEKNLNEALDNVMPVAESLVDRVQGFTVTPSAVEVELGIKFNVKTGAVIASTSLEGNIKLTLRWDRADSPRAASPPALETTP